MNIENNRLKGILLGLVGVILLSPDSLLLRLINEDIWTLAIWRNGLTAISLAFIAVLLEKKEGLNRLLRPNRATFLIAIIYSIGCLGFIFAIMNTAVANALVIMSISPLIAALLSHFFFNQHIMLRTWVATIAIVLGLGLVFSGSVQGGGAKGDIAALIVSFALAFNFVMIRKYKEISMIPAMSWSYAIAAVAALPFATVTAVNGIEIIYALILGLLVVPIGFALITLSPRYISAPEIGLIMLLEAILGPIWVWMVLNEFPSIETILGGVIIVVTLIILSIIPLILRKNNL